MASSTKITIDKTEIEQMMAQVHAIGGEQAVNAFIQSCCKELAARLLAKVVKRTPVGQYPKESGKMGGTLRRGWTAKTHEEAEKKKGEEKDPKEWAYSLGIKKVGKNYVIDVVNPVEYASYVEFGHRTQSGNGWVEGHFFLTISENEILSSSSAILQAKLKKYLKGMVK